MEKKTFRVGWVPTRCAEGLGFDPIRSTVVNLFISCVLTRSIPNGIFHAKCLKLQKYRLLRIAEPACSYLRRRRDGHRRRRPRRLHANTGQLRAGALDPRRHDLAAGPRVRRRVLAGRLRAAVPLLPPAHDTGTDGLGAKIAVRRPVPAQLATTCSFIILLSAMMMMTTRGRSCWGSRAFPRLMFRGAGRGRGFGFSGRGRLVAGFGLLLEELLQVRQVADLVGYPDELVALLHLGVGDELAVGRVRGPAHLVAALGHGRRETPVRRVVGAVARVYGAPPDGVVIDCLFIYLFQY